MREGNKIKHIDYFLFSRAAADIMIRNKSGKIVHLALNVITFGMANLMHYVAAKSAVVGMPRSMARELGEFNITVNAVAPGLVVTETVQKCLGDEVLSTAIQGQSIREGLHESDIAMAVDFLLSPAAGMITGQTLLVNGGATFSSL